MREVLNDANGNLINLYRVVREHPEELKDRLLYVLHNREDFKLAQRRLAQFPPADPIQRAADFYQIIRQSYAGNGKQFCAVARSMWAGFPAIDRVAGGSRASPWKKKISALSSKGTIRPQPSFTSTRPTFSRRTTTPATFSCGQTTSGWLPSCWACPGPVAAVLQPLPGSAGAVPAARNLH